MIVKLLKEIKQKPSGKGRKQTRPNFDHLGRFDPNSVKQVGCREIWKVWGDFQINLKGAGTPF